MTLNLGAFVDQRERNTYPSFTPVGVSEPLLYSPWMGKLCSVIKEWHEANTGEPISE